MKDTLIFSPNPYSKALILNILGFEMWFLEDSYITIVEAAEMISVVIRLFWIIFHYFKFFYGNAEVTQLTSVLAALPENVSLDHRAHGE